MSLHPLDQIEAAAVAMPSAQAGRGDHAFSADGSLSLVRFVDFVLAVPLLIFLAPMMIVTAVLVWFQDGGMPVFGHYRLGLDGRLFRCWKFRSMVVDADQKLSDLLAKDPVAKLEWEADHKLRLDPRVTRLGAFLRKSSLDELPQLINVIAGEMSLVGPRPIVPDEVGKYGRQFRWYCKVRPGITGLWQVSGRNDLDYRRRVALDVLFVKRFSLWLYIIILLRTVPAVLSREGAH
jgi:lipopolysaccharide/colanic/teichoic acid biosynthesis glycosyltransferase